MLAGDETPPDFAEELQERVGVQEKRDIAKYMYRGDMEKTMKAVGVAK